MLKILYRWPLLNIIIILAVTIGLGYGITRIQIDSDMAAMISKENPARKMDKQIRDIYGGTEGIFIGVKSKSGDILTIENIQTIKQITLQIENIGKTDETSTSTDQSDVDLVEDIDDLMSDFEMDSDDLMAEFESDSSTSIDDSRPLTAQSWIKEVKSLANIDLIEGVDGGLEPISFEDYIPENPEELELFKKKLFSWDMYRNFLYSKNLDSTAIIVTLSAEITGMSETEVYERIKSVVDPYRGGDLEYYLAGQPSVRALIASNIQKDLMMLIPIVILVLLGILFISFRNIRGVLLPMSTVLLGTIWVMGLMGWLGIKVTIIGVIIPVILIAIGSAYGIHIITHYMEEIDRIKPSNRKQGRELVISTMKQVIVPVILAAVTTFFGLLSLLTMEMSSLRVFGLMTAIGVIVVLAITIFLIPSMLILLKPSKSRHKDGKKNFTLLEKGLLKMIHAMRNKRKTIIVIFVILIIIMAFGSTRVKVDLNMIKFFNSKTDIVLANNFINENLAGTEMVDLNIIGLKDGDLTDPVILKAMDDLENYLLSEYTEIRKVFGFHTLIKRMNEVMHYPDGDAFKEIPFDPAKYDITDNDLIAYADEKGITVEELNDANRLSLGRGILKQLISQYLVLYSGNMDSLVAHDQLRPIMARMTITYSNNSSVFVNHLTKDIDRYVREFFPEGYSVQKGGTGIITGELNNIVVRGQVTSFIIAILIVFLILSISYKSIIAGIIGIVPLTTSILLNFAVMGFSNISLNIATTLIAALSIGIGVDYTIHFLSFYKKHMKDTGDIDKAIELTYLSSGKAILYNAISVGLGFAVLIFSTMQVLGTFGMLITLVMFSSSMGALTILPIILEVFKPKFIMK